MPPETRYAKKGETSIAYQVVGDGPVDIVFVNGKVAVAEGKATGALAGKVLRHNAK